MEISRRIRIAKQRYSLKKLDHFLKYLIAAEFSLVILSTAYFLLPGDLAESLSLHHRYTDYPYPVLMLIPGLAANLVCGVLSILWVASTNKKGYPGTGLLLNWILIISNAWLLIVLVAS